jgi:ectoine hydroxylase-related dioxygenase (phytanoyl-CoA dioxygenase family)
MQNFAARYATDGIVHVPGVFAGWIDRLNAAFDDMLAAHRADQPLPRLATDPAFGLASADEDSRTGRAHLRNAAPHHPHLVDWVKNSPAAELVARTTGSAQVQLWYDLWFCKHPSDAPGDGATPWHHDASGHPFVGPAMPSLWIALADVGPDDAPLLTFRASHRDKRLFRPPVATGKEHLPDPPGFAPVADMLAAVAAAPDRIDSWTVAAGDALVIHPMTWHASQPQRSNRRRLAMTSRWLGNDLRWAPGPFSFPGFHAGAGGLTEQARPPVPFLPVLWPR